MNAPVKSRRLPRRELVLWLAACAVGLGVLATQTAMLSPRSVTRGSPSVPTATSAATALPETAYELSDRDRLRVTELLVDAVIQVESSGQANKIGPAGERGIMQIKRSTWSHTTRRLFRQALPFDHAFDNTLNRRVGAAYLAELHAFLHKHRAGWRSDERSLLLACYNAGPARVMAARFDVRRLPASVRDYVERASALHDYYLAEDAVRVRMLLSAGVGEEREARSMKREA